METEVDESAVYEARMQGLSDEELGLERYKHKWAVPDRAPSFYSVEDVRKQRSASTEELNKAREEGKIIEKVLSSRGLVVDI